MYEAGKIYHCYNQGNNREKIFLEDRHYLYFIDKMKRYLLPNADILAYCLMPNHFHWLIVMKEEGASQSETKLPNVLRERNRSMPKISKDIAKLLSSYARGFNQEQKRSGSLFRTRTKLKDTWDEYYVCERDRRDKFNFLEYESYTQVCFDYIHTNPVNAGLVKESSEWKFSSAREYSRVSVRNSLCNKRLARKMGLVL